MGLSSRTIGLVLVLLLVGAVTTLAGSTAHTNERNSKTTVTLVLHQNESQSVEAFQEQLKANGFAEAFPPEEVEIISWRASHELGHVIALQLPNHRLPDVRAMVESREWGAIEPKLYSSYDFLPFWDEIGESTSRTRDACDDRRSSVKRMLIAP